MNTPKRRVLYALTITAVAAAAIGFTTARSGEDDEQTTTISFTDAPRAVREAFTGVAKDARASKVERIVDEAVTKYEIEFLQEAGTASATFSDAGEILEIERPVREGDLPAAILREIQKDHPGATIQAADAVQLFYYELEVMVDGKTIEVAALATGDIEDHLLGDTESDHEGDRAGHDDDHDNDGARHDDDDGPEEDDD